MIDGAELSEALSEAGPSDAPELLVLQRCCWVTEAIANDTLDIPALHEDLETVRTWIATHRVWTLRVDGRLVAAVRAHVDGGRWQIGRLMVAPDLVGRGVGRWLLAHAERQAPPGATDIDLFTGARSERNLRMYRRAGYRLSDPPPTGPGSHISGAVFLTKPVVPAWATEAPHVVDHDPAWVERAARFAAEVTDLFAGHLAGEVVHVGSTAVPGLRAKPVIDLQAVSPDPGAAQAAVGSAATAAGWMFVPRELDQRAWRWLFVRVDDDARSRLAHLHLMPPGQDRWHHQLLFRDRLRASPELRDEYGEVKRRALADHPDDREAYGRAKTDFVRRVVVAG